MFCGPVFSIFCYFCLVVNFFELEDFGLKVPQTKSMNQEKVEKKGGKA